MVFDLGLIAAQLEALEETIIAELIERAQFKGNPVVYRPGESGFPGENRRSLCEIRLRCHEEMDARFGRFLAPEERPFTQGLPASERACAPSPSGLVCRTYEVVSMAPKIYKAYLELVPRLCEPGDDGHHGSSVEHDVYCLQSIGRRVHYGALFVAESKFLANPDDYRARIRAGAATEILEILTRQDVEDRIISRVADKVAVLQSRANTTIRRLADPAVIQAFYRDAIIPLTKLGQVKYLLQRLDHEPGS